MARKATVATVTAPAHAPAPASAAKYALMGTLLGALTTGTVQVGTTWINEGRRDETQRRERLERAHARLAGLRVPWSQAYLSAAVSAVYFHSHMAKAKVVSSEAEQREALRYSALCATEIDRAAQHGQALLEAVAEIRLLAPADAQLTSALDSLEGYTTLAISEPEWQKPPTVADIDKWRKDSVKGVELFTRQELTGRLERAVAQLRRVLQAK